MGDYRFRSSLSRQFCIKRLTTTVFSFIPTTKRENESGNRYRPTCLQHLKHETWFLEGQVTVLVFTLLFVMFFRVNPCRTSGCENLYKGYVSLDTTFLSSTSAYRFKIIVLHMISSRLTLTVLLVSETWVATNELEITPFLLKDQRLKQFFQYDNNCKDIRRNYNSLIGYREPGYVFVLPFWF